MQQLTTDEVRTATDMLAEMVNIAAHQFQAMTGVNGQELIDAMFRTPEQTMQLFLGMVDRNRDAGMTARDAMNAGSRRIGAESARTVMAGLVAQEPADSDRMPIYQAKLRQIEVQLGE